MTPKQKHIKSHLFYCLMQLLLEDLDDLKNHKKLSPRMIDLKNNLTEMCEILNNECGNTYAVQKTTYFSNLSNKIYTLMRKEFDSAM